MSAAPVLDRHTLTSAFADFNEVSETLVQAYQALEQRVAALTRELEGARAAQHAQLLEKERLATRLGLLLEALPAGVVVLDGDGRIREVNRACRELLGEGLAGALWRDLVAERFAPRPDDGADVSLTSGRRVHVSTCSLGGEPGQVVLLQDVTETRLLQDQIEQMQRLSAMGEVAARLAHQVRTPLSSALLYAGALGRSQLPAGERERFAGKLVGVLRHLEALVADMLGFARRGAFQVEELSRDDLAQACARGLENASVDTLTSELTVEPGDWTVQGNREALASVVQSLVENAVQMGASRVRVSLGPGSDDAFPVCLTVTDDGPGIPQDLQARIFEPFFTTRTGGTGLGLAVVQAVVRAHGGRVAVAGGRPTGACFSVELPARSGHPRECRDGHVYRPAARLVPGARAGAGRG